MSAPRDDNWGDDLAAHVPAPLRTDYIRWRNRIRACDKNDEVICIAGYLDAHTRIGLDTAARMEKAARVSLAAQKATYFLTRYLKLVLRSANRVQFHWLWFVLTACIAVFFYIMWLFLELQAQSEIKLVKEDTQKQEQVEIARWVPSYQINAQLLDKLAKSRITLKINVYPSGNFAVWSPLAYKADFAPVQEGGQAGALYFHPPNQPAAQGP